MEGLFCKGFKQFVIDGIDRNNIICQAMIKLVLFIHLTFVLVLSQTYTTSLAHDLAHLQSISYENQSVIDSWSCQECSKYEVLSQESFFSSTANIQGYGAYVKKHSAIVIAFRGSVDMKNWLYNLNTITTSYPRCSGCNVHLGFYSAYLGVSPLVGNLVQRLLSQFRDAKLIITGHSLGGAMAVLCALDMKEIFGNVDVLYAFGQPRVGNQKFADFIQAQVPNYYRIVHNADTVPHVPQSILGFKHGGHQIWYTPQGMTTFKSCPTSEDKSCSNSVSLIQMSTEDHSLSWYMLLPVINLQRVRPITISELKAQFYSRKQIEEAENIMVNKIISQIRSNEAAQ